MKIQVIEVGCRAIVNRLNDGKSFFNYDKNQFEAEE